MLSILHQLQCFLLANKDTVLEQYEMDGHSYDHSNGHITTATVREAIAMSRAFRCSCGHNTAEETRIDPSDGKAYSKADFTEVYGADTVIYCLSSSHVVCSVLLCRCKIIVQCHVCLGHCRSGCGTVPPDIVPRIRRTASLALSLAESPAESAATSSPSAARCAFSSLVPSVAT